MISVGDTVDVRQGADALMNDAQVLHVPVAAGDAWGFLNQANGSECWTTEGVTLWKKPANP